MFRWLKGRKDSDCEFLENFQRAAAKGEGRARVNRALESEGVQLAVEPDNSQFCIKASAAIVRVIAQRAGITITTTDSADKFTAGIFAFSASDYLTRIVEAPFEMVSSVAVLDLFGADHAGEITILGDAYNRMSQSGKVIQAIGQNISKWISNPTDAQIERLAELFKLCRRYVV